MTDVMAQIMKEANEVMGAPNDEELVAISTLANQQLDWERQITQLETDLEAAKEALRQIKENLLPEAMAAVGLTEFRLKNGFRITVKDDVYASIRKDYVEKAIQWLDDNGLGGIVKDDVTVKFGRGESAQQLIEFCRQFGYNAEEKLTVHPQTLKATVKEQMAKGVQFPDEFFSIYPSRKTEIKLK